MGRVNNLEEWRVRARKQLPKLAFDFIDGGSDDEVTLSRNRVAFAGLKLAPRVLRGTGEVSVEVTLLGERLRLPVLLGPAGGARMAGPEGEVGQARGASAAGTISVLNGFPSIAIEKVAASVDTPQWFQLYAYRDRDVSLEAIERAKQLGFSALVLTADVPVVGNRERDARNGMSLPMKIGPKVVLDGLRHPRWTRAYLAGGPLTIASPTAEADAQGPASVAEYVHRMLNPDQTWEDLAWLRGVWDGPLLIKGVMCAEDAALAVDAGCDGVIVSNHGGRQLDGAAATVEVLPEVAAAVGDRAVVLIDGGVRRGTDVVKAICLGADACLLGRPWLFAMAAGGQAGIAAMLEQLRTEIVRALQLVGAHGVDELDPELVRGG